MCKETFEKVNDFCSYDIEITDGADRLNCRVFRTNMNKRRCWFLKIPVMGSFFGGCTCGAPLTDGIPCHHMVAAVKSSRIVGLNDTNAMPKWWTTETWCLQFPQDGIVACDFDMSSLHANHTSDTTKRYCPPYSGPNKSGCPKKETRGKNFLEGDHQKRKKSIVETMANELKKKKARKTKSGGKKWIRVSWLIGMR